MSDKNETQDGPAEPEDLFDGIEDTEGTDLSGSLLHVEERPRGILSHTDRQYLAGLKDYKHEQSEANRRQDIRNRVANGLQDFLLLWCLVNEDDAAMIFASLHEERVLNDSLAAAIAFMYRGLDRDEARLETIIEDGVYAGANVDKSGRWAGDVESVDTTIDVERNPDVNEIYRRFKQGEGAQLTPTEIGVLVRAGKVAPDELDELEAKEPAFPGVYFGEGMASVVGQERKDQEQ